MSRRAGLSPVVRRLGDLLVAEGVLTPEQLGPALTEHKQTGDRLGSVLLRLGLITDEQLAHYLTYQKERREGAGLASSRLGDFLVTEGVLTPEQLGQALAQQKRTNDRLGSVLLRLRFITDSQLVHSLARLYRIPTIDMSKERLDPEVLKLIPPQIARKYEVVPVKSTKVSLTLAMADPTNVSVLDDVTFLTGLKVIPVLAAVSAIHQALEQAYPSGAESLADLQVEADAEIEILDERRAAEHVDVLELRASADEGPVVRLVNTLLLDAIRRGASDVHLEPAEEELSVRFRLDGMLHEVMTAPKRLQPAIVSRIKIMASMDIAKHRLPQDGAIKVRDQRRELDLRVSTIPTIFGESVVMRLLDSDTIRLDLAQLGLDPWALEQLRKAIQGSTGMILITGPTGSGKTTTLYAAINTVKSPHINIVTVEDPVEYNLKGVKQVQIKEEIGRTFAATLRSFLRHDPDVILVGEMRDLETAQIAVRAALTGHLVLSTVHTNDCASTVDRLLDMGIPPFLVASSLRLILAQRLVRKVCPECREPYEADEESLVPYGHVPRGLGKCTLYKGRGCQACNATGMRGRVAICEVLPITKEVRDLIVSGASSSDIREVALRQGMKTLRAAGLMKVVEG
ncbi:MAG: ATPase, T2SS/T4P/T4SS family, partial [Candidatus Methylomirabilia bacterium]